MVYQASSPDEAALVSGAELLGYKFHVGSRDNTADNRSANPSLSS